MTLLFFNGGVGDPGVVFTNSTGILTALHDNLVLSGWRSITNTPASNLIELEGQSGLDLCYLRAYTHNQGSGKYSLELRGSQDSGFTILSPELQNGFTDTEWELQFTDGSNNRFWLTADTDAFAIMIQDDSETLNINPAYHFGFYERWDDSDPYAWGVGACRTTYHTQHVARGIENLTNWYHLSGYYHNPDQNVSNNLSQCPPMEGLAGEYTQGLTSDTGGIGDPTPNFAVSNYYRYGNVNGYDGGVYLSDFYLRESTGSSPDYSTPDANYNNYGREINGLYYRGKVRFCATGFSHSTTPSDRTVTSTGAVYRTPGAQGIAIRVA